MAVLRKIERDTNWSDDRTARKIMKIRAQTSYPGPNIYAGALFTVAEFAGAPVAGAISISGGSL